MFGACRYVLYFGASADIFIDPTIGQNPDFPVEKVTTNVSKFRNLRVLSMTYTYAYDDEIPEAPPCPQDSYLKVATALMGSCLSLTLLVFPAGNNPHKLHERVAFMRARNRISGQWEARPYVFEGAFSFET